MASEILKDPFRLACTDGYVPTWLIPTIPALKFILDQGKAIPFQPLWNSIVKDNCNGDKNRAGKNQVYQSRHEGSGSRTCGIYIFLILRKAAVTVVTPTNIIGSIVTQAYFVRPLLMI